MIESEYIYIYIRNEMIRRYTHAIKQFDLQEDKNEN